MAHDIRGRTELCWNNKHDLCDGAECYCECHKPEDERSLHWKLSALASSPLPDSERLQVLIHLTAELAER